MSSPTPVLWLPVVLLSTFTSRIHIHLRIRLLFKNSAKNFTIQKHREEQGGAVDLDNPAFFCFSGSAPHDYNTKLHRNHMFLPLYAPC